MNSNNNSGTASEASSKADNNNSVGVAPSSPTTITTAAPIEQQQPPTSPSFPSATALPRPPAPASTASPTQPTPPTYGPFSSTADVPTHQPTFRPPTNRPFSSATDVPTQPTFRSPTNGPFSPATAVPTPNSADVVATFRSKVTAGFGAQVSIDGDVAMVGARSEDGAGVDTGAAFVFTRSSSTSSWTQQAKLFASDGAEDDWFGESVAVAGASAVVGAFFDDNQGGGSGSAYVFSQLDGEWIEQIRLEASDGSSDWSFGNSVAINDDENTIVVGARVEPDFRIPEPLTSLFDPERHLRLRGPSKPNL